MTFEQPPHMRFRQGEDRYGMPVLVLQIGERTGENGEIAWRDAKVEDITVAR